MNGKNNSKQGQPMQEQWKQDFQKRLLDSTGYSGNKKANQKIISASGLGSDLLQLYLDYQHGKSEDTKFEASNLGSMYQLGVDKACEGSEQFQSALRLKHVLPNGWTCSGEMDQLDLINKVIIDNKVSTTTSKKKVKEGGKDHQYALQLGVYKYLLYKNGYGDYAGALAFIDKGASYFKPNSGDTLELFEVETYDYDEIEALLVDKSDKLQEFIDINEEPPICADRFPFKSKGTTTPMRCNFYCDFNKYCSHYSQERSDRSSILRLGVSKPVEKESEKFVF